MQNLRFFFITNRKLQFFCGSLKHGSVLSMLDNNTKTRTALTLPTDHTNSLAMGLLPTKETQGCRFLRSFFKNQTGHITKMGNLKGDFILLSSQLWGFHNLREIFRAYMRYARQRIRTFNLEADMP